MTTYTPSERWQQKGPYIPFPNPVKGFGYPFYPDEQVTVCVPAQLMPYLIGAAKVLAQPETWMSENLVSDSQYAGYGTLLLTALMNQGAGCFEFLPEGFWECHYDFLVSDGDWELWPTDDGPTVGEWITGVGWVATTYFSSYDQLYHKKLRIKRDGLTNRMVFGMSYTFSTDVDLAPGGYAHRVHDFHVTNSSSHITGMLYTSPPNTVYGMSIFGQVEGSSHMVAAWGDFKCGADTTPSTLEVCSFTLIGATFYGYGPQPDC